MIKFNPFGDRYQQQEIVQVGPLYFEKRGGLTPLEMPDGIQELEKIQAELQLNKQRVQILLQKAAKRISKERGISFTAAIALLFPEQQEEPEAIVSNEEETVIALVEEEKETFMDLLTIEESTEFLALNNSDAKEKRVGKETAIYAATLLIQYRIVHDVHLIEQAEPRDVHLKISPNGIGAELVKKGDRLKFGDELVLVKGAPEKKEGWIHVPVMSLDKAIASEATGFIFDGDRYAVGIKGWTEEHTRKELFEDLIEEIHLFHLQEAGKLAAPEVLESEIIESDESSAAIDAEAESEKK
ncbi:MAG: hypothetical protein F6K65_20420 [Moorea sp. SIO3C2]|nr:hypothetical protein [Moorena sp. SIO3C2]